MHSQKQRLVFFQYIQNALKDKFLHQELKDRKKGIDYETRKYIEKVGEPQETTQTLYELLWTFCKVNGIKRGSVTNTLHGYDSLLEDVTEVTELIEKLNTHLDMLGLPKVPKKSDSIVKVNEAHSSEF